MVSSKVVRKATTMVVPCNYIQSSVMLYREPSRAEGAYLTGEPACYETQKLVAGGGVCVELEVALLIWVLTREQVASHFRDQLNHDGRVYGCEVKVD